MITPRKISPTTSIAVITDLPSSAAVFAASGRSDPSGAIVATLPDPRPVILERPLDRLAAKVVPAQARGLAPAQGRRGRRPRLAVAGEAVRPQPGAERDQSRQVGDGLDRPRLGHAHEPVGVEVVPEQQCGVGVGGREQPRPSVVEEIALVDGLETERVALLAERREDRFELPLLLEPQRRLPEPALTRSLEGDRLPEAGRYSQRASSFVQYETTMSAPARTIAVSDSSAAWRSSSHPRAAAALTIAYSPETL
jgi:hypothetical protein